MRDYSPRFIAARFKCTCFETGLEIQKGDECLYSPALKKVFHLTSDRVKAERQKALNDAAALLDEQVFEASNASYYNNN